MVAAPPPRPPPPPSGLARTDIHDRFTAAKRRQAELDSSLDEEARDTVATSQAPPDQAATKESTPAPPSSALATASPTSASRATNQSSTLPQGRPRSPGSRSNKRHSSPSRQSKPKSSKQPKSLVNTYEDVRRPSGKNTTVWEPANQTPQPTKHGGHTPHGQHGGARPASNKISDAAGAPPDTEVMIKQPETKPISQEQLIAEVKGIYAGLVMVESKCIEVDNAQSSSKDSKLNNEQWQALIALHRTLLHEHHDFFLASQHPSASLALRRLASKYAMPARMWRHGIHSFLELLRHRLPAAREHMLTFIYLAYSMMALLYETVPAFEDTWIECLGDLGRYRMAIEDDNMSDREVWTSVSRHWYSKASDKSPSTGRLYHHLAILARPNALQQLYYYSKALCVAIPFPSARESILTLLDPVLARQNTRLPAQDLHFVSVHAFIFKNLQEKQQIVDMRESLDTFVGGLDMQIARNGRRWLEPGMHVANSNCAALMGYGNPENPLARLMRPGKDPLSKTEDDGDVPMAGSVDDVSEVFKTARELTARTNIAVWGRLGDPSILAHLHVSMVFLHHLTFFAPTTSYVFPHMPWRLLCVQLNTLVAASENASRYESDVFPEGETPRPLVEDFAMRGLLWADKYFPLNWFAHEISDDDKWFEMASFMDERRTRCLWLGVRIAKHKKWITYDAESRSFSVMPEFADKEEGAGAARADEAVETPATAQEDIDAMDTDEGVSAVTIPHIVQ